MFRLLGPVEWQVDGASVELGPLKQRAVWAVLLVHAGQLVTWQNLVDAVWDEAPAGGTRVLYTYVNRIRRILDGVNAGADGPPIVLARRPGGYALQLDPERVDVHRFSRLAAAAAAPGGTDAERADLLGRALHLWRGTALGDLSGGWAARLRARWSQQRLDVAIGWAEAQVRLGRSEQVIGPVRALVDEFPMAEALAATLMQALYQSARPAEALDFYARLRTRLVEELGSEPGPELRAVHQAILREDLDRPEHRPRAPTLVAPPPRDVPAQLPADVRGFTGRARELDQLDQILTAADQAPTMVICTLSGTAGVGKTTLAVHWAHQVRGRYPDGQLYANLRGFDPSAPAVPPGEVVRGFLDALGVPAKRVPAGLAAQSALYRSVLAGKRLLLVLDNAHDAAQVRPLLPGTPGCLVLITSRSTLSSLVATHGAHALALDVLSQGESRELLARRIGTERVASQHGAVDEIVSSCARLPLALAVAAARATTRPDLPLAALATELRDIRGGPRMLDSGDPSTDVRAVFASSYRTLSAGAARLFRLLGTHPGPDLTAPAAASLSGVAAPTASTMLTELTSAHLVTEPTLGRYAFHDLLRAYACELAGTHDGEQDRHAALHRVFDHYLHTALAADRLLDPWRDPMRPRRPVPGVTPETPADQEDASRWFTAEQTVLSSAVKRAAEARFDTHTWQLAWSLATFLDRRGGWEELVDTHLLGLAAARRLSDRRAQARMHRGLGRGYTELARRGEARSHLTVALELFGDVDDAAGQARAELNLAWVCEGEKLADAALAHAQRALECFRTAGDRSGQARALNAVGWYQAMRGDYRPALDACGEALHLLQELGDRRGEASTQDSLGFAHHHLGDYAQAVACYQRAIALHRAIGNRYYEAIGYIHLGDSWQAVGDRTAADAAWRQALGILVEIGHPDAGTVRDRLAAVAG